MSITRPAEGGNETTLPYRPISVLKCRIRNQNRLQSNSKSPIRFAMAKKKSRKRASTQRSSPKPPRTTGAGKETKPRIKSRPSRQLPTLTGLARDLYLQVLNKVAFQDYDECCLVDTLAEQLGKTPGRLQPAIRKLVELGYVTLEGEMYPVIYPTVEALRHQDPRLSEDDARNILAKVRRA